MLSKAVSELEKGLLSLNNVSYDSIDSLMRKLMKSHNVTAKELHYGFKNKHKKTPDDWIKRKMKKLQEDHKEISSGKKADDEGYMARNELDSIERAVKNLRSQIKSGKQQLPAWVQSKITRAADYIDTAAEYLQSDEKVDEEISSTIRPKEHKSEQKKAKIRGLTKSPNPNEAKVAKSKLKGPSLPFKEEISLVEKILGEEKCGKGMYWCNTDKVCKPMPEGMKVPGQKIKPTEVGIGKAVDGSCTHTKKGKHCPVHGMGQCPMSEEKDPKGPTQPYKSPEELAKKHGVSLKEIQRQVEIGTKVEFEHTSDKGKARITALQHLDELPNYYTKLKKMESQKESVTIEDADGNSYVEFVDLIKSGTIDEENPGLWANIHNRRKKGLPKKKPGQKGYPKTLDIEEGIKQARKNVGASRCWTGKKLGNPPTKIKNGKEVPNCVDEAVRIPAQTGNNVFVTLSWRGKYYTIQLFFPQTKVPSRTEISDEIQKIYPDSRVVTYRIADFKPGEPIVYANRGGSGGKLGSNKNYVKPMGEEVEISDEKKVDEDWQKVNRQDKTDGLSQKAVDAYRRENPGSKLKTAVTEKNPTGKRAQRRKSFCSRMSGMKKRLTSTETARDPDSNINKALRRWNCN